MRSDVFPLSKNKNDMEITMPTKNIEEQQAELFEVQINKIRWLNPYALHQRQRLAYTRNIFVGQVQIPNPEIRISIVISPVQLAIRNRRIKTVRHQPPHLPQILLNRIARSPDLQTLPTRINDLLQRRIRPHLVAQHAVN